MCVQKRNGISRSRNDDGFGSARGGSDFSPAISTGSSAKSLDLTTSTAQYKPLFGVADPDQKQLKGIARYGELIVAPGGASEIVSYPAEEQIYYVLEGNGVLLYDG